MFVHGAGESGDGSQASLERVTEIGLPHLIERSERPEDRPFVVLMAKYPQSEADEDCALSDELDASVGFALENYDVDPTRVHVTGISCGAIGL